MATAVVWRKSAYESGKCPECGQQVMADDFSPTNVREQLSARKIWLMCDFCGTPVAYEEPYHGEGKPGERKGKWPEL